MKLEKGMTHKSVILSVIILIILVSIFIYLVYNKVEKEKIETYQTDMLSIQGKAKVLSQESTVQKNEEILKGEKVENKLEDEKINELINQNIISKDEEFFSKYYLWNKEILNELGLQNISLENGFYIVNYETDEVIYSEGINIGEIVCYKLSELKEEKEKQEDKKKEDTKQENTEKNEVVE